MAHVVFFAGFGMLAGALARWLLGRLRRGAAVARPWCELLTGLLWAASGTWWSAGRLGGQWLPLLLGLGWLAVAAGAVDLLRHRLPDALTLPALPVALMLTTPLGGAAVGRAASGAAVLAGGYLLIRLVAPAALGAGDVKLAAPVGAALAAVSWPALLLGALVASVLTLLMSVALWACSDRGVPHGPALLAAGWLVVGGAFTGAGSGAGAGVGPAVTLLGA